MFARIKSLGYSAELCLKLENDEFTYIYMHV